ncbi:hypothetical protein Dsin_022362 [Dipteronia sinensis]|uniref:RING-type E3 ubiquitin transferase n=1 Tax=Dipteronia sinensis TaxID=43782 RepID=A0AAE0A281_9ROSI|nr:hypothetical protein Dsin_022362 [Dipteronia sinensis]
MLMGSSYLVWFNASNILFLLISTHGIATEISYHEHCSYIVPESPITAPEFASLPFPPFQKGYCDGGDRILNPNPSNHSRDNNKFQSFQLQTKHVFKTDLESVFKVEASLIFHIPITNYNGSFSTRQRSRRLDFSFKGFWSEYTGELCMVGQEYASDCSFAKTCNPLGDNHVGFLPQLLFLSPTECSPDGQSVRFFIEFPISSSYDGFQINPFNPNTKFVGEGTWDWKKNSLHVIACRFTKKNTSLSNSQVSDCSIRMNLRFPTIWSIRNSISISGQIWSNKSVNDIGYFERITIRSTDNNLLGIPGFKYEYIETDKVRKSCSIKKPVKKSGENFQDGYSIEMSFYTGVGNSREEFALGYWTPSLWVIRFFRIAPFDISSSGSTRVEISAEGIYDAETGSLCMVGCRYVGLNNQNWEKDTMDCEIRVNLQFSSLNAKKDGVDITGSIISLRDKSDPLQFESVYVSSTSFHTWRIDMEIFMVLISNTLACNFVMFQLLYVKTHPGVLPFISLLMLVVLTLGHMIVLSLNFEAWFFQNQNRQTVLLGSGGWLEVFVAMVAFVLQFRFFKLLWPSRLVFHKSQKASLITETKACILRNSTEKALAPIFYTGYTLSRMVPHAYDLYRAAHNYADHEADFHSIAWNVSIPLGCIFFAVIPYFRQRFGGRCLVPRLFREVEEE